ncbi:MAG: ornithine carbamoyltransferase [Candidatus Omnitrophota bacterium]
MKRDLISLHDLTSAEVQEILTMAAKLKQDRGLQTDHLRGRTVGLVFQKPSNRTRVSFEVGTNQLGGNCIYLGPAEINLGKRETTEDVAKTLSRYLDCIVARTFAHQDAVDLGRFAAVPVINGLSDLYHPCQALADALTVQEEYGDVSGLTAAYVGDGNNVCHSLMLICAKLGVHIRVAAPEGYAPDPKVVSAAQKYAAEAGSTVDVGQDPHAAVEGARAVYADVWTSMGQEEEAQQRLSDFAGYQINSELVSRAAKDHIFLHCLPAHRGEEVTAEVIDGAHSRVFDQAENRMHAEKAVLIFLMEKMVSS